MSHPTGDQRLNSDQFGLPYPRLRESYARTMAVNMAELVNDEGQAPFEDGKTMLSTGREQADLMVEGAMRNTTDNFHKNKLIEIGFRNRKQAKRNYSSWYN